MFIFHLEHHHFQSNEFFKFYFQIPQIHDDTKNGIILPLFYHCFSNIDLRPEINIILISIIDFFEFIAFIEFIDFIDSIDSTPKALYHNDHTWTFLN